MSRQDYPEAARTALDRFDVPPLSAAFADRVVAAALAEGATLPPPLAARVAPRRDRRGLWRRAGQAAIGVAALGMMSAAAVASGFLGAVGIEVPVLSAMLAPEPVRKPKPAPAKKPPVRVADQQAAPAAPPPVAGTVVPPPAPTIDPAMPPWKAAAIARRAARQAAFRAEREAFLNQHPGLREAIAAGPEARKAFVARHPEVKAALRARFSELQARRAVARAAAIERMRAAADEPMAGVPDPARRAAMIERRRARLAELEALDPAERAARIAEWKARRAARIERMRAMRNQAMPAPGEGSAQPDR